MRTEVMLIIDKSWAQVLPRRLVSMASGRTHRRIARGAHLWKGSVMVQVFNRGEIFAVRLACTICGERCRLDQLWLAFPPGEAVQGQWVHRDCVSGQVESAFGTRRLVLMRGRDALQRLAEALDDTADDPALARQRPLAKA